MLTKKNMVGLMRLAQEIGPEMPLEEALRKAALAETRVMPDKDGYVPVPVVTLLVYRVADAYRADICGSARAGFVRAPSLHEALMRSICCDEDPDDISWKLYEYAQSMLPPSASLNGRASLQITLRFEAVGESWTVSFPQFKTHEGGKAAEKKVAARGASYYEPEVSGTFNSVAEAVVAALKNLTRALY